MVNVEGMALNPNLDSDNFVNRNSFRSITCYPGNSYFQVPGKLTLGLSY